ncbi:hypothetical protein [Streptomyces sp. NBC_00299]|nr:hypothetical protein [Streptomyces sp. NBC_00299]
MNRPPRPMRDAGTRNHRALEGLLVWMLDVWAPARSGIAGGRVG